MQNQWLPLNPLNKPHKDVEINCESCERTNFLKEGGWVYNSPNNVLAKLVIERNHTRYQGAFGSLLFKDFGANFALGPRQNYVYLCSHCKNNSGESEWVELDVEEPPEDCKVYCVKCQLKNRRDDDWIHSTSVNELAKVVNQREKKVLDQQAKRLGLDIYKESSGPLPKLIYFCESCKEP